MLSPQGIRGRMVNLSFRLRQSGRKEKRRYKKHKAQNFLGKRSEKIGKRAVLQQTLFPSISYNSALRLKALRFLLRSFVLQGVLCGF